MRIESIRSKRGRILSGFLAFVCFCAAVLPFFDATTIVSRAKTFSGPNIWSGGSEMMFGHRRNYLYRWKDDYQMTFCISPGKHMGTSVTSNGMRTSVYDAEIPYIRSTEEYQLLADICYWVDCHGSVRADNATYAAAQAAVWAVIGDGWESADGIEAIVDKHVPGTKERWRQLKAYIEQTESHQVPMPDWVKTSQRAAQEKPQGMQQENGVWKLELDISSLPQMAACAWDFGENAAGWSSQVLNGKLIFSYVGGQPPAAVVSTPIPDSLADWKHNTETMNIYLPVSNASSTQAMISAGPITPKIYIGLAGGGGAFGTESEAELVIYEHRETFTSHYQIGLVKLCAETGQPLEGAQFRVLEAFDGSQITEPLNEDGMATKPAVWGGFKICGEAVTAADGRFLHSDTKEYEYVKTYCDGHPAPVHTSMDEMFPGSGGSDTDDAAKQQAVDMQNEELDAQWQTLVDLCAAYNEGNHFHHVDPGVAREAMLADREEAYERFLELTYDYTFEETQARYGYSRHGQHNDDKKIPVYSVSSMEAGGDISEDRDREVVINENVGYSGSRLGRPETGEPRDAAADISGWLVQEGAFSERIAGMKRAGAATPSDSAGITKTAPPDSAEVAEATPSNGAATAEATPSNGMAVMVFSSPDADRGQGLQRSYAGRVLRGATDAGGAAEIDGGMLPEPVRDDIEPLPPRSCEDGSAEYVPVLDHRTEGELHINKRDLELQKGEHDGYVSYGDTQGDATLEGAVYGLYAAEDIIHPDGKTGVVYKAGTLTTIAATDKNGDASFMAYTEEGNLTQSAAGSSEIGYRGADTQGYEPLRSWIGRPLIMGRYLVREIARSEGYELTIDPAAANGVQTAGRADVTTAMSHPIDMHDGSWLEFEVVYENTADGFDILVSGFPAGASFSRSNRKESTKEEEVVVGVRMVETGEYEQAEEGEYRLGPDGGYIPRMENGKPLYDKSHPVMRTYSVSQRIEFYPDGEYEITVDPVKWGDPEAADGDYAAEKANEILRQLGYTILTDAKKKEAPWTVVMLKGTTNQEMAEEILKWFGENSFWSCAFVQRIWKEDGNWKALLLHDYPNGNAVYEARTKSLYVRVPVQTEDGGRHMYIQYPSGTYTLKAGYAVVESRKQKEGVLPFGAAMEEWIETVYEPLYERYGANERRLDGNGNPIPIYKEEYITEKKQNTISEDRQEPLKAVYDAASGSYRIHIANTVDWNQTAGPQVMTIRAKAPMTSVGNTGNEMFYSDYLTNITGVGASAFACVCGGRPEGLAELVYPGQVSPIQDGTGTPGEGTQKTPVGMHEKIITQKVKVIKTVGRDDSEKDFAAAEPVGPPVSNFRFKAYLKSNLERIYRDDNGKIVWIDRRGNVIDIEKVKERYPALVPTIYTKVRRRTSPLYKQTANAVIANDFLYPEGGEEPLAGYTAVLETVEKDVADGTGVRSVKVPNYEKFFDAITVANYDKWDDRSRSETSYRPLGNMVNRSREAEENTAFSDMVRQFAIDWYLDSEVAVMEKETEKAYGDQFYDEALRRALRKADNYLKPFFAYDLDEIYAVQWDSDANGGADGNPATVNADEWSENSCYGISAALPYGTYVVAEQQPHYAGLQDFKNRHYRIDSPKEIIVPSVYLSAEAEVSDDAMSAEYIYDSSMDMEEMTERYGIRFGSEIIRVNGSETAYATDAHNHSGDFEIYKYGVDIGMVSNGPEDTADWKYFALTQDTWRPQQNYYNDDDDRTKEVTYYLAGEKLGHEAVGQVYRYSSVAESAGVANGVPFTGGRVTQENPTGLYYKDAVKTISGVKTAYEGLYSPTLVPYSPADGYSVSGAGSDEGRIKIVGDGSYARLRFVNMPYEAKLRIEKMDSETGENLLHDDAVFNIYQAERDESPDGEGTVRFYNADTVVRGSREFLESMGASDIRLWQGSTYQGVVLEGTPVCSENARVFQTDTEGMRVGEFRSFTTERDGILESAGADFAGGCGQQNAGWLETPEPLAAGVYVLAEVKAPAGYVRSRPIAIEVYSDRVTYYQRGTQDSRVTATVYASVGGKETAEEDTARIYVKNTPVRLLAEKRKESYAGDKSAAGRTVTYQISGRIDGNLAEIGGDANYEYAYQNGVYMGYAWRKGTLEYLKSLKDAGLDVKIVYQGRLFAGYGYVTQELETADDANGYVTGALMTLYEGLELTPSGGSQDMAFEGLEIVRGGAGNVTRMYVKEGYAGFRTEFVHTWEQSAEDDLPEKAGSEGIHQPGGEDPSEGNTEKGLKEVWSAQKTERKDTDILFYDLGGLEVFQTGIVAGRNVRYGYDRNHRKRELRQLEDDKENIVAADGSQSIFAFRNGTPELELAGGDFTKITYSAANKVFEGEFARPIRQPDGSVRMSVGVVLYHLDPDGCRDSLVDPYTGMAYTLAAVPGAALQSGTGSVLDAKADGRLSEDTVGIEDILSGNAKDTAVRVLVWPVMITRDTSGHLLTQDKITTSRIATLGENTDTEYLTGTWQSEDNRQSHPLFSLKKNRFGQDMSGEPVLAGNDGTFGKSVYPVYDSHGMVLFYRYSGESYETEIPLYDRSGHQVIEKSSDLLDDYDKASYVMREDREEASSGDRILHRAGESYILENTWVTGEMTPDDPFADRLTEGQADLLRRVSVGSYIMEELTAPKGYGKGIPVGVVVEETDALQKTVMTDRTTKILIGKADEAEDHTFQVLDMLKTDASDSPRILGTVTEGKGGSSHLQLAGARLALYEAERVYTSDLANYPEGSYLRRKSEEPLLWHSTDSRPGAEEMLRAEWTTGEAPIYLEGIPAGEYLLEEVETPSGMVRASALEVTVRPTGEVQIYILHNDHTKVEIEKYTGDGSAYSLVSGAGFTLYEAVADSRGQVIYDENGWPEYDSGRPVDHFISDDGGRYAGFVQAFEEQYAWWGTNLRTVTWMYDGQRMRAQYVTHSRIDVATAGGGTTDDDPFPTTAEMILRTDDNVEIRVTVCEHGRNRLGQNRVFEYRFDYHMLPKVNSRASSYLTEGGMRRLDYLPAGAEYVLVETEPPDGFAAAAPVLIRVRELTDVQRYRVKNEEGAIIISKTYSNTPKELPGAQLALYRAAEEGGLIRDDAYLAAVWVSGQDGRYTETDSANGQIPEGYKIGDLKPHTLTRLPEGDYWLTELESPDYYTTFEPVKIEYHTNDPIRIVRVSDVPVFGSVTVKKTDSDGNALMGAVFALSAFRQPDLKTPVFTKRFGGSGETAVLEGLQVGEIQSDGSIIPYCYRLQEILPPDGYAVNPRVWTFEFSPDQSGVSYIWGETAEYEQTVADEKTRVTIRKKDFGENDVSGAELSVYPLIGTDENGSYLYDPEAPADRWITLEAEPDHVIEGLVAGRSYLLKETKVPAGYEEMEPVVFTLSADGRRIASISGHVAVITIHDLYHATLRGRYAVRNEMTVTDRSGRIVAAWTASGSGRMLTEKDGILNGEIYTLTEKTVYSDGSVQTIGRRTERLVLAEGSYRVEERWPERVYLRLRKLTEGESADEKLTETESAGTELAAFVPTEKQPELKVGGDSSKKELFANRTKYVLEETTYYHDGSTVASGRMTFGIGDDGCVTALEGYDRLRRTMISKTDVTGQKELPGARLQILDAEGNEIEEWISGETPHLIEAILIPGEMYTLRETLPPEGYAYASDITFAVSEDGSVEQVVMKDAQTRVSVTKTDISGQKELPGAKLQIFELEEPVQSEKPSEGEELESQPSKDTVRGRLAEEWISDGEPHEIVGKLTAGKPYILHEEAAPAGYARAEDIVFMVSRDGNIDHVTMKDEEIPYRPREPKKPEFSKPKQAGTVEATYQVYLIGSDAVPLGALEYRLAPETGDNIGRSAVTALILMICSAVMCGVFWKRTGGESIVYQKWRLKKKERPDVRRRHGRFMVWIITGAFLMVSWKITALATERSAPWTEDLAAAQSAPYPAAMEEAPPTGTTGGTVVSSSDTEIVVRYKVYPVSAEAPAEMSLPPDIYLWQEEKYRLKAYQTTAVTLPELVRYARESVQYEGVEKAASIPETIEVSLQDEDSGRSAVIPLPLESIEEANGRWTDGFSFSLTVHGYENGNFILGGETVQVKEEEPFVGYEEALLELIGVDPAYYQIDTVEWSGEAQVGENGEVCRPAVASGRKYVTDVTAVYDGRALIPAQPGMAYEAVYEKEVPETESDQETMAETSEVYVEASDTPVPAAAVPEEPPEEPSETIFRRWIRILQHISTTVVGLGILLLPLLLWLFRVRKRKKKESGRKA